MNNRARRHYRIALMALLMILLVGLSGRGHAAGLDCPDVGSGAVPLALGGSVQAKLITSGNAIDVANEVYALINRLQIAKPDISASELTNALIAAYCPAVANMPGVSAAEKWQRMRQFDAILRRQVEATNLMPPGSLIIANVSLPPAVYDALRNQAATVNQTPAQLMTAILTRAAGK